MGSGVSGGEDGARYGPSMMPGGAVEAWLVYIAPTFTPKTLLSFTRTYSNFYTQPTQLLHLKLLPLPLQILPIMNQRQLLPLHLLPLS